MSGCYINEYEIVRKTSALSKVSKFKLLRKPFTFYARFPQNADRISQFAKD